MLDTVFSNQFESKSCYLLGAIVVQYNCLFMNREYPNGAQNFTRDPFACRALGLGLGLAACGVEFGHDGPKDSLPGDEHLVFEKNECGDAYTVLGLKEECPHTEIVIPVYPDGRHWHFGEDGCPVLRA